MIGARKLLKDSFHFLLHNPLLFFYGFIYFLPVIIAIIGILLLTISVGTLSLITFSFPTILKTVFGVLLGSVFAIFFIMFLLFAFIVISLGFTAYIQDLLRGSRASVRKSIKHAFTICSSVVWVVPVYLVYSFLYNSPLFIVAVIAFWYVPQLLVDRETSFGETFSLSWHYFKKTFWVTIRFFILIIFFMAGLIMAALLSVGLAALFIPVPGASFIFALFAIVIFFILFLFSIMASMIITVGINKLYLEAKQQN
jgi:hypothetical protein